LADVIRLRPDAREVFEVVDKTVKRCDDKNALLAATLGNATNLDLGCITRPQTILQPEHARFCYM
jgi:hypothetical protein